jgi:threonine dehydrogenase-like Zn-dependent dehydrogenase
MDTLGMAQPMAIASHCITRSRLAPGDLAVIVGAGGIGAFLTYAAAQTGAEVWVLDLDPDRLVLAGALGAHRVVDARSTTPHAALHDAGRRADILFEVTGTQAGLVSVLDAAQPGATIVPVGVQKTDLPLSLGPWTLGEYTVVGSNAHVFTRDIPRALDLLASRTAGWNDVANEVRTLEEVIDARLQPAPLDQRRPIKLLVDPSASDSRPARHNHHLAER